MTLNNGLTGAGGNAITAAGRPINSTTPGAGLISTNSPPRVGTPNAMPRAVTLPLIRSDHLEQDDAMQEARGSCGKREGDGIVRAGRSTAEPEREQAVLRPC